MRPEELSQWKISKTSTQIEPPTSRLVEQSLNQPRYRVVPRNSVSTPKNTDKQAQKWQLLRALQETAQGVRKVWDPWAKKLRLLAAGKNGKRFEDVYDVSLLYVEDWVLNL